MEAPDSRLLTHRSDFHQAVLDVIAGTRQELCLLDATLADWPLESRAAIQGLEAIVRNAGATLKIIVHRPDFIERQAPRLTALRRRFSDRITIRVAPANLPAVEGLVIGDGRHLLRRASPEAWRSRLQFDAPDQVEPWRSKFAALWDACETELGLTTLGL